MATHKVRLGKDQVSLGGRNSQPAMFYKRYTQLNEAHRAIYQEEAIVEAKNYQLFLAFWEIAICRIGFEYDAMLLQHKFTRNPDGKITRMETTAPDTQAPAAPKMSAEAMQELLARLKKGEPEAIAEFDAFIATMPADWLSSCSLLEIAKSEFFYCLAKKNPASRTILEHSVNASLAVLQANVQSPMERLLIEHIQVAVLAAEYNNLMLIDNRRSMRERSSFEKRAIDAVNELRSSLRMYHDYKILANSNWTKLPSELPFDVPAKTDARHDQPSEPAATSSVGLIDEQLCSMVI